MRACLCVYVCVCVCRVPSALALGYNHSEADDTCGGDILQVPSSCHTCLRNEKEIGPSGQACVLLLESRMMCFIMSHNLIPVFAAM